MIDKPSKVDLEGCICILNGGEGQEDFLRCYKSMRIKVMEGEKYVLFCKNWSVWLGQSRARNEVRKLTRGRSCGAMNTMSRGLDLILGAIVRSPRLLNGRGEDDQDCNFHDSEW